MKISPKKISGNWTCGYSLDFHTLSSKYIGDNEYGHPQFVTEYSDIGGLLNRLKYKSDRSVLRIIVETVVEFLNNKSWQADLIIPVPPSREKRVFQPVIAVAKEVSKLTGIELCTDCVVKVKATPELKNMYEFKERIKVLTGAFDVIKAQVRGKKVVLFDDLYRSGATLKAITQLLKYKGQCEEVYVLTLTMTRKLK